MFEAWKNVAGAIALGVLAQGRLFAQQSSGPDLERYRREIQDCIHVINSWQWQAHLQAAFVLAVILFGALVTIFQSLNKNWCKLPILILGGCITIFTGVNAKVFSADYRVLEQSVIDANDMIEKLNRIVDELGRPQADVAGLEAQWINVKTQFSGLRKAVLMGKTAAFKVSTRTVYAQGSVPTWVTHPPSDAYNLYFAGTGEDRSLTVARQQSMDNAVTGLARLSGQRTDCDAVRRVIASSAATDKSYFEFDKSKDIYRYYTLLRISGDIRNLHVNCESSMSFVVPGQTKWMDTGIHLRKGDKISFTATGQVEWMPGASVGPEGSASKLKPASMRPRYPVSTMGAGGLIAKIGSGEPMAVGRAATVVASNAGTLYLGINDNSYKDNRGQFSVVISLTPSQ